MTNRNSWQTLLRLVGVLQFRTAEVVVSGARTPDRVYSLTLMYSDGSLGLVDYSGEGKVEAKTNQDCSESG